MLPPPPRTRYRFFRRNNCAVSAMAAAAAASAAAAACDVSALEFTAAAWRSDHAGMRSLDSVFVARCLRASWPALPLSPAVWGRLFQEAWCSCSLRSRVESFCGGGAKYVYLGW